MALNLTSNNLPKVDLSFTPFNNEIQNENLTSEARSFLTKPSYWNDLFTNWINFIKEEENCICYEEVKEASFFSLGLQFIGDETIKTLNKQWRNKAEKTDVLSFPAIDGRTFAFNPECTELGDIVVSIETAYCQAKYYGHSLKMELSWLISHGLLHLLGWDHPDEKSLEKMLSFQEKLLKIDHEILD